MVMVYEEVVRLRVGEGECVGWTRTETGSDGGVLRFLVFVFVFVFFVWVVFVFVFGRKGEVSDVGILSSLPFPFPVAL